MKSKLNRHQHQRGMTLIIVLSALTLLTFIFLAVIASVQTEVSSSDRYSRSSEVKLLSDSTINLVIAQIRDATGNGSLAWTSQPGLIRTFNNSGNEGTAYKLYSSNEIRAQNGFDADDVSSRPTAFPDFNSNWDTIPAQFTDLNEPVLTGKGGMSLLRFPIVDPRAQNQVEGFSFNTSILNGSIAPTSTTDTKARLPMPVRWLYMLQNGTLVAATPGSSSGSVNVPGATQNNPVIGRVAFWTDDESCRLNVNTSAGGTFWDRPLAVTDQEEILATRQPAQGEYTRYSGHPATTSLKPIFRGLFPAATDNQLYDFIYKLAPRIGDPNQPLGGGSQLGTINPTAALSPDTNRLYANIGDILFEPGTSSGRPIMSQAGLVLDSAKLEASKFFLTHQSKSPEVNLFNLPRISLWPIHQSLLNDRVNPTDRLLAFCSTLGTQPFYFQRSNPGSETELRSITRNSELYTYLQRLTASPVPGFGGTFETKYGTQNRDQILTQIFDHIRTANLSDATVAIPYADPDKNQATEPGQGQVRPTYDAITDTKGFGRFPTLNDLTIYYYTAGNGGSPPGTTSTQTVSAEPVSSLQHPNGGSITCSTNEIAIQAFVVCSFVNPSQGYSSWGPSFTVEIEGLDGLSFEGQSLGFTNRGSVYIDDLQAFHGRDIGGLVDHRLMLKGKAFSDSGSSRYELFSQIIKIPMFDPHPTNPGLWTANNIDFACANPITVRLYYGDSNNISELVQEIEIPALTAATFPMPAINSPPRVFGVSGIDPSSDPFDRTTTAAKFIDRSDAFRQFIPQGGYGDLRLLAAKRTIPLVENAFSAHLGFIRHPDGAHFHYDITDNSFSYNFYNISGTSEQIRATGTTLFSPGILMNPSRAPSGQPVPGLLWYDHTQPGAIRGRYPTFPSSVNGCFLSGTSFLGDWDNGIGSFQDGPWISKIDEGRSPGGSTAPYYDNNSGQFTASGPTFFSPNRQIPSPIVLGSLPSEVHGTPLKPWQTLLFRPDDSGQHPGAQSPRDHLLADLFWMPIVEPYAISSPLSTTGKVNLNHKLAPFPHITRTTALRGVVENLKMTLIPDSDVIAYKSSSLSMDSTYRLSVDAKEFINEIDTHLNSGTPFISATEVCELPLRPEGATSAVDWSIHRITGDNAKESPYNHMLSRLTTKSNTFTIYYRVQALKKSSLTNEATFVDPDGASSGATDQVTGEERGSATIERFIDLSQANVQDFATISDVSSAASALNSLYQYRVVNHQLFSL
ncbi:MAG: Verru_Chthon cassette protein A [Verrucomicrobiota bacterium]